MPANELGPNNQSRPCHGDSGGPLVISASSNSRLLHTGIASSFVNGVICDSTSGQYIYSGLSEAQFQWLAVQLIATKQNLQLPFDCASTTGSLSVFACDNDGTVF